LPLVLGVVAAAMLYTFIYVRQSEPFAYVSIAGLIFATLLNVAIARKAERDNRPRAA